MQPVTNVTASTVRVLLQHSMPFYAVRIGRRTGIFRDWNECEKNVKGVPNASYVKFKTLHEAETFLVSGTRIKEKNCRQVSSPKTSSTLISSQAKEGGVAARRVRRSKNFQPPVKANDITINDTKTAKVHPEIPFEFKANIFMASGPEERLKDALVLYCDGACPRNGKSLARAGYGVHFPTKPELDTFGQLSANELQTNQRAELTAIKRAIEITDRMNIPVEIRTDSMYSIKCLTVWYQPWEQVGWEVKKKNLDLIRSIIEISRQRFYPVYLVF